jgi:hypothetical protein
MKGWPYILGVVLLTSCGNERLAGGSTSETSNGLAVFVLDSSGKPAARVRLRLRPLDYLAGESPATSDPSRGIIDTATNDSGVARLSQGIPSVNLEAFTGNYAVQAVIDSGVRGIFVQLVPAAGVRGRVDHKSGLGPARIQFKGLEHSVWTDSSGAFQVDSLPPGRTRLRAWVPGPARSTEVEWVLPSGSRTDVGTLEPAQESGNWSDSVRVVLNTLDGAAVIATGVDSVPILVRMDGPEFPASARHDGADLRVLDSVGNPLPFCIASWSAASLTAHFWVQVPVVRARDSTQWFRVRWGNPQANDVSTPWQVFSAAEGWAGAWDFDRSYLDRGGVPHVADASSWGDDGLITGAPTSDPVDGLHFKGGGKDGVAASGVGTDLHGNFTVLIRARPENPFASFLLRGDSVWNHNKKDFYLGAAPSVKIVHKSGWYPTFMGFADTSHNAYAVSNVRADSSAWVLLVARHTVAVGDSGAVDWFMGGGKVASTLSGGTWFETDDKVRDSLIVGWRAREVERFRGAMAEIWILDRAVGDDWVLLESECRKDGGGTLVRLRP